MKDVIKNEPLSYTLNNAVLYVTQRVAPPYTAQPDAPSSYSELVTHLNSDKPLIVYDGGSDSTIFADPAINHAFRAWHDWTHYRHGYDFSVVGEMWTCNAQIEDIRRHLSLELVQHCVPYLTAEIIGQRLYYELYGQYIEDQRAFVLAYLNDPTSALAKRW